MSAYLQNITSHLLEGDLQGDVAWLGSAPFFTEPWKMIFGPSDFPPEPIFLSAIKKNSNSSKSLFLGIYKERFIKVFVHKFHHYTLSLSLSYLKYKFIRLIERIDHFSPTKFSIICFFLFFFSTIRRTDSTKRKGRIIALFNRND